MTSTSHDKSLSGMRAHPPFAQPGPKRGAITIRQGAADPPPEDDLPPIEQFLDELPSIDDYVADERPRAETEEGWAVESWQSFDWSGVSSLGRAGAEADAIWGMTDWPAPERPPRAASPPGGYAAADEVASLLDEIARRIRSGELTLDPLGDTSPEAAFAAGLAALLRRRT